jgi:hypothetical protein
VHGTRVFGAFDPFDPHSSTMPFLAATRGPLAASDRCS